MYKIASSTRLSLISLLLGIVITLFSSSIVAKVTNNTSVSNIPITIDADNQQIDIKNNIITFIGNVVITQDTLKVQADKVIITEIQNKEKQEVTAYGQPVYFEHIMVNPNNDKQKITGHANKLTYNIQNNLLTLDGDAELFQQDNHILGTKIVYHVKNKTIVVTSGKKTRVKTTIMPTQISK